jgi:hypothetical protein
MSAGSEGSCNQAPRGDSPLCGAVRDDDSVHADRSEVVPDL